MTKHIFRVILETIKVVEPLPNMLLVYNHMLLVYNHKIYFGRKQRIQF